MTGRAEAQTPNGESLPPPIPRPTPGRHQDPYGFVQLRTAPRDLHRPRPGPGRHVQLLLVPEADGQPASLQARFPNEQVKIEGKSTAWKFPIDGAKPTKYRTCAGCDGIVLILLLMWSRLISALCAGQLFTISESPIPPGPA